jgi:hypothetical protein
MAQLMLSHAQFFVSLRNIRKVAQAPPLLSRSSTPESPPVNYDFVYVPRFGERTLQIRQVALQFLPVFKIN